LEEPIFQRKEPAEVNNVHKKVKKKAKKRLLLKLFLFLLLFLNPNLTLFSKINPQYKIYINTFLKVM
jgi:hypothetical protein